MKTAGKLLLLLLAVGVVFGGARTFWRYRTDQVMVIPVEEVSTLDYPEDPAFRSVHYDRYQGRHMRLLHEGEDLFTFILESDDPAIATISVENVDLGLFVPALPEWTKQDPNLELIALVDREWNRQQVRFPKGSAHVRIAGGDGFEQKQLESVELARNCLNAGLWEILLFTREDGKKALYYQGWFNFPLGHYKRTFERKNGVSYWKHWHRLEHWMNPQGTPVELAKLRDIVDENPIPVRRDADELVTSAGEQVHKARTVDAQGVRCWGDICRKPQSVRFAAFVPPGRYKAAVPWGNEFERIGKVDKAVHRRIKTASGQMMDELEIVYRHADSDEVNRFIVSGVDLASLPSLPADRYNKGLYMPMGIGVPPFYQSYDHLESSPPYQSPYFSVLLDKQGRWIDHHRVAIDGPVIHRDLDDPRLVHLFLLSYERHTLVDHLVLQMW